MRVTDFETFLLSHQFPDEHLWWGGSWDQDFVGLRFNAVVLRVRTDEGISGLGEAVPWGFCEGVVAAIRRLQPRFVGRSPSTSRS